MSDLVQLFGAIWFLSSLWILRPMVVVSSVCDDLGNAINEMVEVEELGAVAARMPTKDQHYL